MSKGKNSALRLGGLCVFAGIAGFGFLNRQPIQHTIEAYRTPDAQALMLAGDKVLPGAMPYLLKRAGAVSVHSLPAPGGQARYLATFKNKGAPSLMLVSGTSPRDWHNWTGGLASLDTGSAATAWWQGAIPPEAWKYPRVADAVDFNAVSGDFSLVRACDPATNTLRETVSNRKTRNALIKTAEGTVEAYGPLPAKPVAIGVILKQFSKDAVVQDFQKIYQQGAVHLACSEHPLSLGVANPALTVGMLRADALAAMAALQLAAPADPSSAKSLDYAFSQISAQAGRLTLVFSDTRPGARLTGIRYVQQFASNADRDAGTAALYDSVLKEDGEPRELTWSREWSARWKAGEKPGIELRAGNESVNSASKPAFVLDIGATQP